MEYQLTQELAGCRLHDQARSYVCFAIPDMVRRLTYR